ncbi:V-type ATP synthase subunit E [candidate division TA06 bacterium]|uniref:V-type proton ATPase subunit E n=1 Tax=candidate division TA06 bacterium TaxID=2250710 RepID=A0A523UQV7_UNCT6|nr:MAG: V-type ATP synthase subunit E [candidate division TA06 bacterium]
MAEKVVSKIINEADAKAKELVASARTQAERIAKQASHESARIAQQAKEASAKRASEEKQRVLSSANLDIRKAMLEKKQELMDEAFQKAITRLRQKNKKEYVDLIKELLLKSVETGTEDVIVGTADKDIIDSKVISAVNKKLGRKGNLTLSKTFGSMAGGFILRRGKIDTNLSFDGLIELAREGLETEVAKILFEE